MTGPSGNSEFCFSSTLNVPLGFVSDNRHLKTEIHVNLSEMLGSLKRV